MKEVLEGRQSFRNPNLVHVLNKFNFIENYATGIKKIIEAYEKYDEKPIFNPTDNFFIVTLPNVNKRDNGGLNDGISGGINELGRENAGIIDTVNDTVNDTVKQLILRMKEKPNVTIAELSNELHKSRITIIRTINKLKEQGYLARVGSDKTGYWKVLK
ncbi:MAG: HTH domain-containing protein [Bacilli bacterium]|nr:HTH domain-containing protein [Bacilli bacterium]